MIRHITIFRMKNSCSNEHGKLCFGAPEIIFGTPKQLATRLKARGGLHSEVVTPENGKKKNKNWKNDRHDIQTSSQETATAEKENELYSCFQSIANRIFFIFL